jgi:tetratricopeptide (TPR) repeat protein
MAEGEFALVGQHLKQAIHKDSRGLTGDHDLYAMLADVAAQQRDAAALREYIPLLEETAASLDHTLYLAIAHRAWGVIHLLEGEYVQAEARLNQALESFQALETSWQIGRTLYELADLAQARGKPALARNYYSRALVTFEDLKALPDLARTQAALLELD